MFDDLYTRLISIVNYRVLIFIPPVLSVLMIFLISTRGIPMGIDFQGGTWMDILIDKSLTDDDIMQLRSQLTEYGLEDLKVYQGYDLDSKKKKLTVVTINQVEVENISRILEPYTGRLIGADIATIRLDEKPPIELTDKLEVRLKANIDLVYSENTLTIESLELDSDELESALSYYLGKSITVSLEKKNFNSRTVGPTLGRTFKEQGIKAMVVAFILMGLVIFFAFRDFIPSLAVMQAGISDVIITAGFMSLFQIPLEPASLAALLMLIGYSVDSDILLTARCLRSRKTDVDERLNDAMKTGLTMTGTTLCVMAVIYVVSTTVAEIAILKSIAQILLFGLFADLMTTWFTNAGIMKWYLERSHKKFKTR